MAKTNQKRRLSPPKKEAVAARLKLLEAELARLHVATGKPVGILPHGLQQVVGSFRGDDDFAEAMMFGAKWRSSSRPKPATKAKKSIRSRGKHAGAGH